MSKVNTPNHYQVKLSGTSIDIESSSTLQNYSPVVQARHFLKVNRNNLHVPDPGGSKLTINTAFGSQIIEAPEEGRQKPRPRRILSSIASSSDEPHKSFGWLNKARESKSWDPLPFVGRFIYIQHCYMICNK